MDAESEEDTSRLNTVCLKQLKKIAALDSNAKTKNVIRMASHMLYDGRFAETFDQNLDIISLGGGKVYNLNKGRARKALPSNRVSLSPQMLCCQISLMRSTRQ